MTFYRKLKKKCILTITPTLLFVLLSYQTAFCENDFQALYEAAKQSQSIETAQHALQLALAADVSPYADMYPYIAKSYFLIAYLQNRSAHYFEALNNYFSARHYYRISKNRDREIITLMNIGIIYAKARFYRKALSFYQEGLDLSRNSQVKGSTLANLQYQLAKAYRLAGDFKSARKFHHSALAYYLSVDNPVMVSDIYTELGLINLTNENFSLASKYYGLSVSVLADDTPTKKLAILKKMNSLAYKNILRGKLDNARHILYSAISKITDSITHHVQFDIFDNLAAIYAQLGLQDSAIFMYEKSVQYADTTQFDPDYLAACDQLYHHYKPDPVKSDRYHRAIVAYANQLTALREGLDQAHVQYQVEAAEYRRQYQDNRAILRTQIVVQYITYPALIAWIIGLIVYHYHKERTRRRKITNLMHGLKI